jgi:acetyl/propionyl-CoA carboxylase alpha subunit
MVTGLDLVEWQLRVARGERLPLVQEKIECRGHAMEARLYAEEPASGFLPQTGVVSALSFPKGPETRIDSGIETGDTISIHYDPMVAKLIVAGRDRAEAIAKLSHLLEQTAYIGPKNNRRFLLALLAHPDFIAGKTDTSWLDRNLASLTQPRRPSSEAAEFAGRLLVAQERSPFRVNLQPTRFVRLLSDEGAVSDHVVDTTLPLPALSHTLAGEQISLQLNNEWYAFTRLDPRLYIGKVESNDCHLRAPMPGRIIAVLAKEGQILAKGVPLVTLEAMKMEHTIKSPSPGRLVKLRVMLGEQVSEGAELVEWEPEKYE